MFDSCISHGIVELRSSGANVRSRSSIPAVDRATVGSKSSTPAVGCVIVVARGSTPVVGTEKGLFFVYSTAGELGA